MVGFTRHPSCKKELPMRPCRFLGLCVLIAFISVCLSREALAQFTQQGPKLVGMGAVGNAEQGYSVSLSSDGNTAIVGGPIDNTIVGAAWIFTRSGSVWTQLGSKLVGTGAVGSSAQGSSVALSGDGNTAIVGAVGDNGGNGAVWIFTRSGGVWTQQGSKLVPTDPSPGIARFGFSVALSSDGNTAAVGGYVDNNGIGATWIFTRSGVAWTQQGSKLVGTGATGPGAQQGHSVGISGDGNTAISGGSSDNNGVGATWVFTRSGSVWTQQGSKLIGSGAVGTAAQGYGVTISSDGNTAMVGGPGDNSFGAAWIFTRSGGVWTQQGNKLVGTGSSGSPGQGYSVSLSSDGSTAVEGGPSDASSAGAAWIFTRSGGVWTQQGNKLVGVDAVGNANQGISVALSADARTAIVGGDFDNGNTGAAWIFAIPSIPTTTPLGVALLALALVLAAATLMRMRA
jgi:hypothetical protein